MAARSDYIQSVPLHDLRDDRQHRLSGSRFGDETDTSFQYGEDASNRSLRHAYGNDKDGLQYSSTYASGDAMRLRQAHLWSLRNAQSWTLERLCLVLSLACMVALLVLFVYFDNKPLSNWRFYFSLNTVASTLGTVAKSTLMLAVGSAIGQGKWQWFYSEPQPLRDFDIFDEATRGPLGSLNLLWTLRARHMAAVGAFVTVLSVASDPFLQAVVNYHGRLDTVGPATAANISLQSNGFVARTDRWAGLDNFAYIQAASVEIGENKGVMRPSREDFDISSAFYSGTSSYDNVGLNSSTPFFSCATGNCTSPIYTSIAVCSQCADLSGSIKTSEVINDTPEAFMRSVENTGLAVENYTNYTLPNLWTDNCCAADNNAYTSYMTAVLSLVPETTNAFKDMETMLAAITFMRATPVGGDLSKLNNTLPMATECALYLCVNAYQSNVTNGFMDERLLESWTTRVPASYAALPEQPTIVEISNASAVHSNTWMTPYQELYLNRSDYQLSIALDGQGKPQYGADTTFAVSQAAIVTFQDFMSGMFTSRTAGNASEPEHELAYGHAAIPLFTTPILQPFLGNVSAPVNLTDMFGRIARSMTSNVRNAADGRQPTTQQQYVLHFRIVWGFFALPFGVTVLGCLYALYTIQRTKRQGLPAWKTSMLASLTHGIDADTRDALKALPLNGQKDVAGRTYVRLEERDGVVALRGRG